MTIQERWIGSWNLNNLKSKLLNPQSWQWDYTPSFSHPRLSVLVVLALYIVLDITVLGFNRSLGQLFIIVSSACLLDKLFYCLFGGRQFFFLLVQRLVIAHYSSFYSDSKLVF